MKAASSAFTLKKICLFLNTIFLLQEAYLLFYQKNIRYPSKVYCLCISFSSTFILAETNFLLCPFLLCLMPFLPLVCYASLFPAFSHLGYLHRFLLYLNNKRAPVETLQSLFHWPCFRVLQPFLNSFAMHPLVILVFDDVYHLLQTSCSSYTSL